MVYKIKLKYIIIIISFLIEFLVQLLMSGKAIAGDHVDYRNYFDFISQIEFTEFIVTDSAGFIGSYDYLYNFLVYFFSRFSNFDFFTFIINILFFLVFVILFTRINLVFILPLIPFTFYIVGLQFSAQRLILAIAIFCLAYMYLKTKLSFLSLLVHVQIAPLFMIYNNKIKLRLIILLFFIIAIIAYYFDITALQKLLLYAANRNNININDFLFLLYIFFNLTLTSRIGELKKLVIPFLIFSILILLIGDGRINIIIYVFSLLFLQNLIKISALSKISLFIFLAYDFLKGVQFIGGIMNGDSGFDSINIK